MWPLYFNWHLNSVSAISPSLWSRTDITKTSVEMRLDLCVKYACPSKFNKKNTNGRIYMISKKIKFSLWPLLAFASQVDETISVSVELEGPQQGRTPEHVTFCVLVRRKMILRYSHPNNTFFSGMICLKTWIFNRHHFSRLIFKASNNCSTEIIATCRRTVPNCVIYFFTWRWVPIAQPCVSADTLL